MVRLNLREVEQNADFSYLDYWKSIQNGPSSFWVILEIKRQLALLSLAQKVFRNPTSELTKPHTHLIRFILSGSNSLTV